MNDCRIILKQKNPSEGSDVRYSKKREQQIRQQPQCYCCPVTDVLFVKRLEYKKQHVENISHMYVKNSWGEAHYHATCRRDYTWEGDRHQVTVKDTKTIEEQASNKTI